MEVRFFVKTTKPLGRGTIESSWVKIYCTEEDYEDKNGSEDLESVFVQSDDKTVNIPIFATEYSNGIDYVIKDIRDVAQRAKAEAILVSSVDFFKKAVIYSQKDEMDPHILTTQERNILYYACVGEDKCALMVAYEELSNE